VGLVSWRMVRDAHHVKSLFNTGVVLYLIGIAVLVLLGMISGRRRIAPGCRMRPICSMSSTGS
jgi:uncharacterized membrane protein YeiB